MIFFSFQAIRRGLVSTPPSHMIGDDRHSVSVLRLDAWVRGTRNSGLFVRPRLFMPYFEECKVWYTGPVLLTAVNVDFKVLSFFIACWIVSA